GARLGIDIVGFHLGGDIGEAQLAGENVLAQPVVPTGIALIEQPVEFAILDHGRSALEATSQRIEPPDMAVEQIGGIERLATQLGVEIETALAQPALLENV